MTVQMTANATGLPGLQGGLDRMKQLGYSPRPIFQAIANYGEASTRLRFNRQVGPDGQPWQPSHRARATGSKTLVLKARLLRSITSTADRDGAEWGTNVKYAAIHQFGGEIKRAAYSSWLRLRTDAGGALLRQKKNANLSVFARVHHKRAVERRYTVAAHSIKMPARPFLGVNEADGREMERLTVQVIDQAAQRRGGE